MSRYGLPLCAAAVTNGEKKQILLKHRCIMGAWEVWHRIPRLFWDSHFFILPSTRYDGFFINWTADPFSIHLFILVNKMSENSPEHMATSAKLRLFSDIDIQFKDTLHRAVAQG